MRRLTLPIFVVLATGACAESQRAESPAQSAAASAQFAASAPAASVPSMAASPAAPPAAPAAPAVSATKDKPPWYTAICASFAGAERLRTGMTPAEIEQIVGAPTSVSPEAGYARWYRDSPRHVNPQLVVRFENGRAVDIHCSLA